MAINKVTGLLQMAFRAGKIIRGDGLIPGIQSQKVKLVLYSCACGENRKKKLKNKSKSYGITCLEVSNEILDNVSYKPMSSLGVSDAGFAKAIQQRLNEEQPKS